ncbi:MAG: chromate transporter [Prochlorotrichaceae cyanobacterium]
MAKTSRLQSLALLFLKLGLIGFGGPQAHIALQHEEAVVRRAWLSEAEFTEGIALCEMLPGPASTQMGMYLGYLRAGHWGAIVSGICFIAPAYLIVLFLSWGYFRFQDLPQISALFLGISPVVTAIVLAFCWKLGQKVLSSWQRWGLTIAVFLITTFTSVSVLLQFFICGLLGSVWFHSPPAPPASSPTPPDSGQGGDTSERLGGETLEGKTLGAKTLGRKTLGGEMLGTKIWGTKGRGGEIRGGETPPLRVAWGIPFLGSLLGTTVTTQSSFWGFDRLGEFALPLGVFFLKVGSFIFGGGLVIIPLLEFEVVERLQWLTHTEFINGVAIGQLSPGPVVLTAAFVGYKVAGVLGSLVATIAIFLPSFLFILLATPFLLRLRQNLRVKAFLQGVTPGVLGAIAAAAIPIAQASLIQGNWQQTLVACTILGASLIALIRFKVPTWQLVPAGAILGLVVAGLESFQG